MGGVKSDFEAIAEAIGVSPDAVRFDYREQDRVTGVAVDFGGRRHAVLVPFGRIGEAIPLLKQWQKENLEADQNG